MRVDTEELLTELFKRNIDVEITTKQGLIELKLIDLKTNIPIIIKGNETLEGAFAAIIYQLAKGNIYARILPFQGLTKL